jgi:N-methylhydantoinase A/acetophenone carboxylase
MTTIDIDIGGTFTDGFFTQNGEAWTAKVLTTPHDLTQGLLDCLAAGAERLDLPLPRLLRDTAIIRLSTTLGTNSVIQRKGPKIGLLVTAGEEGTLYSTGKAAILGRLIPEEMVIGVREEVDAKGAVRQPPERAALLSAIRQLIETGARMIVVSLRNAWVNPGHERAVRELLRERYPVHYLRSVPLQLAHEISHVPDDHARTNTAVVNAYIHREMARGLFRGEDLLREQGLGKPLLVVHASGGCARVAKTTAAQTLNSGPAVAVKGAEWLARLFGWSRVLTTDMGGTSFDIGLIVDGRSNLNLAPTVEGFRLATPMIEVESIGAGGGSLARVAEGRLRVGPESAGALPGPVCYDKGGGEPTVTDADLILGYLDPHYFLGGRLTLNRDRAAQAIQRRVGTALGVSVETAALRIREEIQREMAERLGAYLRQKRCEPQGLVMLSFGGAGPLHCCGIAERIGIGRVVTFPFGSVFSAFGSSTTDIVHNYLRTAPATLGPDGNLPEGWPEILETLRQRALRDMAGEGHSAEAVRFTLELIPRAGPPPLHLDLSQPVTAQALQAAGVKKALAIDTLLLSATAPIPHWSLPRAPRSGKDPSEAKKGERPVWWNERAATATPVYERDRLRPGNLLRGPALIESADTVGVVPSRWRLLIDEHGTGILEREG